MRAAFVGIVGLALAASAASAQYNTGIQPGPFNSDGPAGDPTNGVYSFNYSAADAMFNRVRIRGTATSGGVGSFLSELRWQLVLDSGTRNSNALASGTTWTGGVPIDNMQAASTFSLVSGNNYSFRFWESFNDGGVDATWTDVQFDLSFVDPRPQCTDLGAMTSDFDIDTFGSSFDTELGLYDDNGNLLANNDDSGGLQSRITGSGLADGRYYIAIGGFNTIFGGTDWNVTGGAAHGDYLLDINGVQRASGNLPANSIAWYCVTVPTPGAAALLGLGGLLTSRRRR